MPDDKYPNFPIFFFFGFRDRFPRGSRRDPNKQERSNTAKQSQQTDKARVTSRPTYL